MEKNLYEIAFERYLRSINRPFLSNRQERRFLMPDGATLKNFDAIVSDANGRNWIVDVKGRLFPGGRRAAKYSISAYNRILQTPRNYAEVSVGNPP